MPVLDSVGVSTPALMLQGTGSDVGKSLIVAGLGRLFHRRGLAVLPFKPQNMSNNAAVAQGGEIGRAQALQARAAGVSPQLDMNPVLLKPHSEIGSQIIIRGRVAGTVEAANYHSWRAHLLKAVLESFDRLAQAAELILIEGAGSTAEVNLRAQDIANMGFAQAADVPVVLVGDIERGGVIASIVGTVALLKESERARLHGFIINKFHGDIRLFDEGVRIIEEKTGLPCLGVVPYCRSAHQLPAEDSMGLDRLRPENHGHKTLRIAVPRLPRIANFDDLDPLFLESSLEVSIIDPGIPLPGDADGVILLGSKATRSDLEDFRNQGWEIDLQGHRRRGGWILGICGGYQMLGRSIADPLGLEGPPGETKGLGFLEVSTCLEAGKIVRNAEKTARGSYEIHAGRTTGPGCARPFPPGSGDGAISADGRVMGCYLHGLFADDHQRRAWLNHLGTKGDPDLDYHLRLDHFLDDWADHLHKYLDCDRLLDIARGRT